MKHSTPPRGKCRAWILALMLLVSMTAAWADDSGLITQQITVNVATAGTLSDIIQSDKMYKITNLKITGNLNQDDFTHIRKMAGCYYDRNKNKYDGHLQHLDLGSMGTVYYDDYTVYDEDGYSHTLYSCAVPLACLYNLKSVVLPSFPIENSFSLEDCRNLTSVDIPGRLQNIGYQAFKGCSSLTSIRIPSSVTSIGNSAFKGCSGLTSVIIPSSVASIGHDAFYGCSSLKSISFPEKAESIPSAVCQGCSSLESVAIPSRVTSIDDYAFKGCSSLTSVELPQGVRTVNAKAFQDCTSLVSIHLPENLESIGDGAFSGCTRLSSIDFPMWTSSIGTSAFKGCSSLEKISFPATMAQIGKEAFSGCSNVTSIKAFMSAPVTIDSNTFSGISTDRCTLSVPQGAQQAYWLANGWGSFSRIVDTLPNTIIRSVRATNNEHLRYQITSDDKYNISQLKVTGPIGIDDIRFMREMVGCYNSNGSKTDGSLRHINLRDATFAYDAGLNGGNEIIVYDSKSDGNWAEIKRDGTWNALFYALPDLRTLILPDNKDMNDGQTTVIGESFCQNCTNLESVTFPSNVKSIGDAAFLGCENLTSAVLPDGMDKIDTRAFQDCKKLAHIYLPSSITTIERCVFYKCPSLTSLTLPASLTTLGDFAFSDCTNLTLTSDRLPQGLTTIESSTFQACQRLTSIVIPEGVTSIQSYAFYGCKTLASVIFPSSLTSIEERAFYNCSLTSATLPEGLTDIGEMAFFYNYNMKNLTLPSTLRSIGDRAFSYCYPKSIYSYMQVPVQPVQQTYGIFSPSCYSSCILYVPQGSLQSYRQTYPWSQFNNIQEFDELGVDDVNANAHGIETERYDESGHLLTAPVKGLNIVRCSDGTVKKVMVE